jgi:hypothetical protein
VREAQRQVRGQGASEWWRLITAASALIRFQLATDGPLLRTAALSSMPHEHQVEIMNLSYKASRLFSAMIADAISEGSARAVDPAIAGALVNAAINVGSDIRMMRRPPADRLVCDYARPLFTGLLPP